MTELVLEFQKAIQALDSTLLGIIVTMIIGAIGYAIAATNETRKWQRQVRHVSFAEIAMSPREFDAGIRDLIEVGRQTNSQMKRLDAMESTHVDFVEHSQKYTALRRNMQTMIDGLEKSRSRINRAHAACEILISNRSSALLDNYARTNQDWTNYALTEDQEHYYTLHVQAWEAFLDQAQRDLGLRRWWNQRP